jgi:hypothetical protein
MALSSNGEDNYFFFCFVAIHVKSQLYGSCGAEFTVSSYRAYLISLQAVLPELE